MRPGSLRRRATMWRVPVPTDCRHHCSTHTSYTRMQSCLDAPTDTSESTTEVNGSYQFRKSLLHVAFSHPFNLYSSPLNYIGIIEVVDLDQASVDVVMGTSGGLQFDTRTPLMPLNASVCSSAALRLSPRSIRASRTLSSSCA